jgi:hypothetical protein
VTKLGLDALERAEEDEEGEQLLVARAPAGRDIAAHEGAREPVVAAGDVHHEGCEVARDVGDAPLRIEVDRVDDLHVLAEHDVLGEQVAVPVAYEARRLALAQARPEAGQARAGEPSQRRDAVGLELAGRGLCHGRERRLDAVGKAAGRIREPFRFEAGVEASEPRADRAEVAADGSAGDERRGQRGAPLVAAHRDRVLDRARIVLGRDRQPRAAVRHERDHADVDARGQAAVDADFLGAARPPALERSVVDRSGDDGLLDLVGAVAGQEDPRDVGLSQLDLVGAVGERARVE